ncbi:nicastrin [Rhopalosiphum maidis]|uniref:nicastrin n=1 Tax=Rhopalosiphum maidis TaxID=43146 RepID=UPI000F00004B|nr:nicastrin [Rhopalosiphum maidis]
MITVRHVLFVFLHYATYTLLNCLSVKDQMYENIIANNPCFLRLNGTNQFGCTSSRFGNVGTLHLVTNSTDLDWLFNEGKADPYTVALTPKMFNREVLQNIELSTKVNGIMLLMNGTEQEVINNDNLQKNGFSPEDTCPNRYSDVNSCPMKPWNPYGTDILLKSWSFPIFLVYDQNTIKNIIDCFTNNNLPLKNQNDQSLCALELKSHMYAAVDSKTCLRRTMMSYQNIRPIKFCDPLGDKNVYWSLKELRPNTPNQSIAIVAARLDATSMFQDLAPGALSTATSIVTLMTTANLISEMLSYNDASNFSRNVMFILFNGEAYDYIGSSRVVYDMLDGNFPNDLIKLNKSHVGMFVELSQIHYDKEVVFYRPMKHNASDDVQNFMETFTKSLSDDGFSVTESKSTFIPPSSLHSFLKLDPKFPGLILTGFNDQFKNKFYHSILDDAENIQYNNDSTISKTIANISTSLSYSLYKFITNSNYNGLKQANSSYVTKLLDCYVKSMNCEIFQSLTSPLHLPDSPPNYYVSIDMITNTLTSLSRLLFASFGSKLISKVQNEEKCLYYRTKQGFVPVWLRGNYNACYSTTSNVTDAVSPAFIIPDYDLSSSEYSTWTESVWHEVQIRMFLRQSLKLQIIIFVLGILVFLFSFIIVKKMYDQSGIHFNNQEVNSVTNF